MSESDRDERIRRRAYERYEQRGRDEGGHVEDWLEAEREDYELFNNAKAAPLAEPTSPRHEDPDASDDPEAQEKEDKINEAAEESFPASDAPAWRGGSAN
jgi:uridine kinase